MKGMGGLGGETGAVEMDEWDTEIDNRQTDRCVWE